MGRHVDCKDLVEDYIHEKTKCLVVLDVESRMDDGAFYTTTFAGSAAELLEVGEILKCAPEHIYIQSTIDGVEVEFFIKESWKEIVERLEIEHALL